MTKPTDRPTPHASFDTPEMIAARTAILDVQNALRREFLVREFSADGIQLIIRLQARLTDAWVIYDNLLYDAGRSASVPWHDDTDLLLDAWSWFQLAIVRDTESVLWWNVDGFTTLECVARVLVQRGVLEKHATMPWYRRAPTPEVPHATNL